MFCFWYLLCQVCIGYFLYVQRIPVSYLIFTRLNDIQYAAKMHCMQTYNLQHLINLIAA